MRLAARQMATICETVYRMLGASAEMKLFGSRLDDGAKGGGIGPLVEWPGLMSNAPFLAVQPARALRAGHDAMPELQTVASRLDAAIRRRG